MFNQGCRDFRQSVEVTVCRRTDTKAFNKLNVVERARLLGEGTPTRKRNSANLPKVEDSRGDRGTLGKGSPGKQLKRMWKKQGSPDSLKSFAKLMNGSPATTWFESKR